MRYLRVLMPSAPLTFRERDVKAAIRAVRKTGETVAAVEIVKDGTIRVIVRREGMVAEAGNPWDAED